VFRLMPKQQQLFERFERLAELGQQAAALLHQVLRAPDKAAELLPRIEALEQQGDDANHEALAMLQKAGTLPIDRDEVVALLGELDDLLDGADAAAHRVVLYRVQGSKPEALKLGELLEKAAAALAEAVRALRTGKDKSAVQRPVVEVNRLENEGDTVTREAIGALFTNEQNAIELIKWKELFELLEDNLDGCERVANRIEAIALKHG
jgi:predicted phosphate transport protein (TIGR00153 family)